MDWWQTLEFRQLGRSGLTVSVVGLGCNNFGVRCDFDQSEAVINSAIDNGITFFDTADIYGGHGGSETIIGKVIKGRRDQIVLASKFGMDMGTPDIARGSRSYVRKSIEGSLRRLQTDYLDLYQFHRPDPLTPIEETLAGLDELVKEGKVRYIGCSNFAGWQIAEAELLARMKNSERFISAQNHYSLIEFSVEEEVIPACVHFGLGMLPFYPLASGLLTGKFQRGQEPPKGTRLANRREELDRANWDVVEGLSGLAKSMGVALADLAISALASKPAVASVIAGATRPEQVASNVKAIELKLNADDMAKVREITGSLT
ncbi:MAG: aldo/keto reductase [Acidimicrobiaceae bacterium]|nr:aldo/keto reductase [Acidimicrobiaceae bacterium]